MITYDQTPRLDELGGVKLLKWLYDLPQFLNYTVTREAAAAFADEVEDLPITLDQAKDVCRSLMSVDDRMPSAPRIRRRALEHTGIVAPSWEQAIGMIHQAMAADDVSGLPGPVRAAVQAKGGLFNLRNSTNPEASFAQIRDTYLGLAEAHDRFVLEPGGLEAFFGACQVVEAHRRRMALLGDGRWAAMMLGWDDIPGDEAGAQEAMAAYQAEHGRRAVRGVFPAEQETRDRRDDLRALAADLGRRLSPAAKGVD